MKRKDGIIRVIPGERYTPIGLAERLGAQVILESSSYHKGRERYSLLMVKEAFRVAQRGDSVYWQQRNDQGESSEWLIKSRGRDILDVLVYFSRQHPDPAQDFPFPAGGLGFLSYEFCSRFDTIKLQKKQDDLDLPDALFLFGHVFLIFDHYTDLIYILGLNYKEAEIDLAAAVAQVEQSILSSPAPDATAPRSYPAEILNQGEEQEYMDIVARVREEIIAGNLLQAVPSRRLLVKTEIPALEAYRALRSKNPSPYLFYLDFGDFQLFGSSPEVHVKVRDRVAEIRPIAGTRRRGQTEEEDKALEKELLEDVKERAEHLMLVDLARNDLGRICKTRSVEVKDYYTVERYSHVMHLVSRVTGELGDKVLGIDAIRSTFPAGTVSGAPKIRAIETIDALEKRPRRFYAGLVGWLGTRDTLDTCIAIRSAYKKDDLLVLQAGAGVVYDSVPQRELEETKEKLMALAAAVGLEV